MHRAAGVLPAPLRAPRTRAPLRAVEPPGRSAPAPWAPRWAVSSCPLWRNSSPSRGKTRLSGSCASWEDRVLISSGMRPRPGERLGRRLGEAHLFELRQLRLRACGEPFPLVPLLHRLAEPARADERVTEHPVRGHGQRIEPERAAQLLDGIDAAPGGEGDAAEQ